jgi:hypothetical protein
MQNKEAFVRNNIVFIGLPFRIIILLLPFSPGIFGEAEWFRLDEKYEMLSIILPVTALYFSLFIKFIIQNRYQRQGQSLGKLYIGAGFFALIILSCAEIFLVTYKGRDASIFDDERFFLLLGLFEAGFGIYAGFYLSDLFGKPVQPNQ